LVEGGGIDSWVFVCRLHARLFQRIKQLTDCGYDRIP
jgi:hypothetical protein